MFIVEQEENNYIIKEDSRIIFTAVKEIEDHVASLYLRNIYGDEAVSLYQVKHWFSLINSSFSMDYTVYDRDDKLGELRKDKVGFNFEYLGKIFHIIGRKNNDDITLKIKDQRKTVALFIYKNNTCEIKSTYTNIMYIYGVLACLFFDHKLQKHVLL